MNRTALFLSPGFLLGLTALAVNDFLFKPAFHNVVTGKLSDFAGLWAFGIFLVALIPKYPRTMLLISGAIFLFWKSSYSQSLIDIWNTGSLPRIGRVIDATDYIAIIVLPCALSYIKYRLAFGNAPLTLVRKFASFAAIIFSLVFFTATQFVGDHVCCSGDYRFKMTKDEFLKKLSLTEITDIRHVEKMSNREEGDWYSFYLKEKYCGRLLQVNLHIKAQDNETQVSIAYILYNCKEPNDTYIQQKFEQEIVAKIKPVT